MKKYRYFILMLGHQLVIRPQGTPLLCMKPVSPICYRKQKLTVIYNDPWEKQKIVRCYNRYSIPLLTRGRKKNGVPNKNRRKWKWYILNLPRKKDFKVGTVPSKDSAQSTKSEKGLCQELYETRLHTFIFNQTTPNVCSKEKSTSQRRTSLIQI